MTNVVNIIWAREVASVIESYTDDQRKYMDQRMIDYMNDNLKDPARKKQFLQAVKRFRKLAEYESDPVQSMMYEYRMYLSETQAKILAKEFYQKEIRSGTFSDTKVDSDNIDYSLVDSIEYGNHAANKGMFASMTGAADNPETLFSTQDFFSKLFSSRFLDKQDRIVLVTYLLLGLGPSLRAKKGSNRQGLDLGGVMDNPPEELATVEEQIAKLLKFGLDPDSITAEKVLQGIKKDGGEDAPQITPLVSTKRVQVAQKNIQAAVKDLTGMSELKDIRKFLVPDQWKRNKPGEEVEEAITDDSAIVTNTIVDYLGGDTVTASNLIKAIVYAVNINIVKKTRLSKSKLFSGNVKSIASTYLKLAKAHTEVGTIKVQDLFMAPILDKMDKRS